MRTYQNRERSLRSFKTLRPVETAKPSELRRRAFHEITDRNSDRAVPCLRVGYCDTHQLLQKKLCQTTLHIHRNRFTFFIQPRKTCVSLNFPAALLFRHHSKFGDLDSRLRGND
jgi:hypothetical protein